MAVAASANTRLRIILIGLLPLCTQAAEPAPAAGFDPREVYAGGAATTPVINEKAYSQFAPNLGFVEQGKFRRGDMLFRGTHPGQGPLFNASTCQTCHVRDGRGHPSNFGEASAGLLIRLGIGPGAGPNGIEPDPTYGYQLQTMRAPAVGAFSGSTEDESLEPPVEAVGEGVVTVDYQIMYGEFPEGRDYGVVTNDVPDGKDYVLFQPVYRVRQLSSSDFDSRVMFSPRVASPVFGAGLLEAIPQASILEYADAEDTDGDGISGRPNFVWDVLENEVTLGRFGHKANQPSILQQLAGAYSADMGITNALYPFQEPQPSTASSRYAQNGTEDQSVDPREASDLTLALMEFYLRTLAVPERRNADSAVVLRGKQLFYELRCPACHRPSFQTGELQGSLLGEIEGLSLGPDAEPVSAVSGQVIWPYTDLLLHDMGGHCEPMQRENSAGTACEAGPNCAWRYRCNGLADGRPDFQANGREWRTPPLWGLGLAQEVNPNAGFLHDGRARTLLEAVLWHGGEAERSRNDFVRLPPQDRSALLSFLNSL